VKERILAWDARWTRELRVAERPGLLRSLATVLAHSGDSWFWLAGLLLLWWLGPAAWKTNVAIAILCILITAVAVMAIKFTVRRQRPEGEWGEIYRKTDPHSFPSGHAVRAAMLAALGIGLGPAWLGALLLIWALLVALARVAMGVHYLSDVVAGGVLGLCLGALYLAVIPLWLPPV
jgi:undecaprenyl-diphosphatase